MDKIFYCRIDGSIEQRFILEQALNLRGFKYVDVCGLQMAFEPNGRFSIFKKMIDIISKEEGINILEIKHCYDPGIGLF